jgi:hypothetical protein
MLPTEENTVHQLSRASQGPKKDPWSISGVVQRSLPWKNAESSELLVINIDESKYSRIQASSLPIASGRPSLDLVQSGDTTAHRTVQHRLIQQLAPFGRNALSRQEIPDELRFVLFSRPSCLKSPL